MTQNKPHSGELVHYGVKGMRWGVSRTEQNKPNAGYSENNRNRDRQTVGDRGVKRINRRLNKGETYKKAKRSVQRNQAARHLVVAGALIAGPLLADLATMTSGSVAQRAQTKRGQSATASAMGLPSKASTGPDYAKQKRGAYNISSF